MINKYWEFNSHDIEKKHVIKPRQDVANNDSLLRLFEFEVVRYKDKNTKKEELDILAKVNGEEYGTIRTNLIKLEKDIVNFKSYGVVLERTKYIELCKIINDKYYTLEPQVVNSISYEVTKEISNEILEMLCDYINSNNIQSKEVKNRDGGILELYHIPLKDFNSEIKDSEFKDYNFTDIKESLNKNGYTHTNKGKFDYVVNDGGQKIKMISIHKKIADSILNEFTEKEAGEFY